MNIELIKKLIKLANNNPNDNEANLAARKVCSMLADYNFNVNTVINEPVTSSKSRGPTYNDIRRTTDPFWNSNPFNTYQTFFSKCQKCGNNMPNIFGDKYCINCETELRNNSNKATGFDSSYNPTYDTSIKRKIKCSKCNEIKTTRFRGVPETWICMDCRGKESFK